LTECQIAPIVRKLIEYMRKYQIGVMGSMADLDYAKNIEEIAEKTGRAIAESGAVLMFGAEKDYDSLSTAACRGAKEKGGTTVGITYGKGLDVYEKENVDVVIATGLERGGGREMSLVLSCDAIICINGGSGTLNEIVVAYQANIPVIVMEGTGGTSELFAGKYIDSRERVLCQIAKTPEEAVRLALKSINHGL
jgi:uncharacterized protein (TIGR00725 family)